MNCEEIRSRLSKCLDGELDQGERKLLGNHIENCPGCAEELDSLKEYFKSIGSLEKREPPPDFLRQVHARLGKKSAFKTVIKKIAFPLRFKIPLEVAGLAAAAVLIVYILNISPEKQSVQSLQMTESVIGRTETDNSLRITDATRSLSRSEGPMMVAGKRRMKPAAPLPEDLLLSEEAAPMVIDKAEPDGGGMRAIELVLLIEPGAPDNAEEYGQGTALLRMQARELRKDKSISSEVKKEDDREATPLTRLGELIAREGGEIISTEEMTDLTRRIAIKLPPDRYHSFMEKLSEISNLQLDRMVPPEESEQTIRLRLIRIMKMKNFHD